MNTEKLIRWAGLPAMAAGIIFVAIQPFHPADFLSSVTTDVWVVIQSLKTVMCLLFLLGITGLYARQAKAAGWLGLVGFLLFSLAWALELPFVFMEAFALPVLAPESPSFVEGFLSIINESANGMSMGALPTLYALVSGLILIGSVLFGIATFRAGILSRGAAVLLAVAGPLSAVLVSLLPHHLERMGAFPLGVAVAWLGYSLFAHRRASVTHVPELSSAQLQQSSAK